MTNAGLRRRTWLPVTALALATVVAFSAGCWEAEIHATTTVGPADIDGPAAWYPLDDPAAAGFDKSGHHLDALPVIFVVKPDAVRGPVAQFDGGALIMLPMLKRDFTISLWLKTTDLGPDQQGWVNGPRIIDADIPGANHIDFGLSLAVDKLAFGVGNATDPVADATALKSQRIVVDGAWHHVALVRDGQTGRYQIFVDGAPDAERVASPGDLMLPPTITLGDLGRTSPVSPPLHAALSDVRFYDRLLSAAAIAFLATPP